MTTRQEIADALSEIPGFSGSSYRPSVVTTGNAWPQLTNLQRDEAHNFIKVWSIYLVGPQQDDQTFGTWFDANAEDIAEALIDVVFVDGIEPVKVAVPNSGDLYAIAITARSE